MSNIISCSHLSSALLAAPGLAVGPICNTFTRISCQNIPKFKSCPEYSIAVGK